MTDIKLRYAQVEEEALAVMWPCKKFTDYIIRKEFRVETNHKPLVPLLESMSLVKLSPRVQLFRERLM